jgi:hypothetical protein
MWVGPEEFAGASSADSTSRAKPGLSLVCRVCSVLKIAICGMPTWPAATSVTSVARPFLRPRTRATPERLSSSCHSDLGSPA